MDAPNNLIVRILPKVHYCECMFIFHSTFFSAETHRTCQSHTQLEIYAIKSNVWVVLTDKLILADFFHFLAFYGHLAFEYGSESKPKFHISLIHLLLMQKWNNPRKEWQKSHVRSIWANSEISPLFLSNRLDVMWTKQALTYFNSHTQVT